jgi:hypothetical protein
MSISKLVGLLENAIAELCQAKIKETGLRVAYLKMRAENYNSLERQF